MEYFLRVKQSIEDMWARSLSVKHHFRGWVQIIPRNLLIRLCVLVAGQDQVLVTLQAIDRCKDTLGLEAGADHRRAGKAARGRV